MTLSTIKRSQARPDGGGLPALLNAASVEVMPRTAAKVPSFRDLFAPGTRFYVAHIDGTEFEDMLATARRLAGEGFAVMPHFPARSIADRATLETWARRYAEEAGVTQALVLAGGIAKPRGSFDNSLQLLETGVFDRLGYTDLHVAGHPENNRDIDPDGGSQVADQALLFKQGFAERTDARMAVVTQFVFDAAPVINWARRLQALGVTLPIHVGLAGPAKLQTLIKYAIACGVGPSLGVLTRRAADVTKLLTTTDPGDVARQLASHCRQEPQTLIRQAHLFPLGGIAATADWLAANRAGGAPIPLAAP